MCDIESPNLTNPNSINSNLTNTNPNLTNTNSTNSTNSNLTNSTILLKGLDPLVVFNKYISNYYKNVKLPSKKKLVSNPIIVETNIGKNHESKIYEFVDWSNSHRRVVSHNHEQYIIARDLDDPSNGEFIDVINANTNVVSTYNKNIIPETPNKVCHWCRRTNYKNKSIGLPISMEYNSLKDVYIFIVHRTFCSYGCLYALVKKESPTNHRSRNPLYIDSEMLTLRMFSIIYPNKKLKASPDWLLLDINGGSLNSEEFDNNNYFFRELPNIIFNPFKTLYAQSSISY